MTREELELNHSEPLVFFDYCDEAIIGLATRCGMRDVVCYDYDKLIECLKKVFDLSEKDFTEDDKASGKTVDDLKYEAALEWYEYNISCFTSGDLTPIVVKTNF